MKKKVPVQKVPVIDLPPAEFLALSKVEGWQAEQRFEARRRAGHRVEPVRKAATAGVHPARSLPSGPAPDWRVTALALAASAVVLPVALCGYVVLSGAAWGWEFFKGWKGNATR